MLCPRQLQPNRSYTAFLLPAFETGRKAGFGPSCCRHRDGTTRSWEGTETLFPIYYEWTFQTGGGGDFETLVRSMVPRDVDPAVGVRDMDVTHPGFGLEDVTNPPAGLVGLEGALLAPTSVRRGLAATSNFVSKVQPILNSPADARDQGEEDPLVAPPIYGCWHARVDRVNAPGADAVWVNQLNLDPRYRAGAGLGRASSGLIKTNTCAARGLQIGDVLGVNRKIRRAQLAIKAASAVFSKSVASLPPERSIALLSPVFRQGPRRFRHARGNRARQRRFPRGSVPLDGETAAAARPHRSRAVSRGNPAWGDSKDRVGRGQRDLVPSRAATSSRRSHR